MPLYEITSENFVKIAETSFDQIGLRERDDLQRLLKKQIDVIAPDTLVVSEEFGEWEDSKRRIDSASRCFGNGWTRSVLHEFLILPKSADIALMKQRGR